jgi:SAM-dependent methyltransferase
VAQTAFDEWIAAHYEELWPEVFEPATLDPAVAFLAALAGTGPVLELGIGTGRVAIPLSRRGLAVHGIELSPAMVERLGELADGTRVVATVGDFATTTLDRAFRLVYLVRNTITNLTTEDEQVACFENAAAHLEPGGHFVVENYVPQLRRLPPGETSVVFTASERHIGVEDYDLVGQIAVSRHWWRIDGELRTFSSPHRYVWPSELDLMARLAGLRLVERWAGWEREPFEAESPSHVSVWQKPADDAGPRGV